MAQTPKPAKHQVLLILTSNLVDDSHVFRANIYKALLELFPHIDLRHLPLHTVSPMRSNSKQMYKAKVYLIILA